jgi:hypothetical protein
MSIEFMEFCVLMVGLVSILMIVVLVISEGKY